jgi:hypothetical protein
MTAAEWSALRLAAVQRRSPRTYGVPDLIRLAPPPAGSWIRYSERERWHRVTGDLMWRPTCEAAVLVSACGYRARLDLLTVCTESLPAEACRRCLR